MTKILGIEVNMKCTICGTEESVGCDCWEKCSCGWSNRKGRPCNNPNTTKCSSKLKYKPSDKKWYE
jgi:hypothetical protein